MHRRRAPSGFTLIEWMIVVAIITVLASMAMLAYQDYFIRAQVSEGMSLASGAKSPAWNQVSNTGEYPPSVESAGMAKSTSITGSYVSSVNVKDRVIKVLFDGSKAINEISNVSKNLVLSPVSQADSID